MVCLCVGRGETVPKCTVFFIAQILRRGSQSDRPQRGQLVEVKCTGRLEDGTEVDKHDCLRLTLGSGEFVTGELISLWMTPSLELQLK